ncbi:endonuclease/exonuclease/phosphatase family protein [Actinomadura violacea]|uniref:Endonuclease/exonuclease/phosphatase family protein n=1 Tax=Actinomadura violacea TaxID=2819934 RepID=A0ABS3S549_9ACTN|nr:endonuclease/exonuclease/phosphatase family protein [Actinomadura violacea]MBO2464001.1 endonuclease/exonuclease/phosphatase family protein [Actinomadura violacea]
MSYNLRDGGLDGGTGSAEGWRDDTRLKAQMALLRSLRPDLLALQEAKWGLHGSSRLKQVAKWLDMTWTSLAPSNFYGCDIAVLVRESNDLAVTNERHLTGPPFVHAHADIELRVTGHVGRLHFMAGHAAPSSPTMRLAESEMVGVYRHLDVIYVADFNAAAIGEDPDVTGVDPLQVARKLDTRPAEELAAAGFCDVGAHVGDRAPTVGHTGQGQLAYRCDRIYTTLPRDRIVGYHVVQEERPLSDHRPVCADIAVGR